MALKQPHAGTAPAPDSPGSNRLSIAALLLANLLPVGLVVMGAWDVAGVVFFYWIENLVIGIYNLLRIATARKLSFGAKAGTGAFFALHYGVFCFVHLIVLIDVFGYPGLVPAQSAPTESIAFSGVISAPELLFPWRCWLPLLALVVSHGLSFVTFYWLGGERLTANRNSLMRRPYKRIVVMHLWLFAGGMLIERWHAPMAALLALVLIKTAIDVRSHRASHRPHSRGSARRRFRRR